mgnify:CR=1 FL=1
MLWSAPAARRTVSQTLLEGNWLHAASDAERERLEAASVGLLARLHDQVPLEAAEFLTLPGDGDCLRRHVTAQRAYYDWVVEGRARSPLIEAAFDRLEDLWPPDSGTPVLNWGDARIGNVVYDGFEPAAVLDWEMAALAPPARSTSAGVLHPLHPLRRPAARDRDAGGRLPAGALR